MPRPISWLSRFDEIRRSVKNSVRSHYERADIEHLFQIQPRAAQILMQAISPAAKVGNSFLLARTDLETFLDRIQDGADPASLLSPRSAPAPRRRLRDLVQVDHVPATLDTAPTNIDFQPGQLIITFASMEELAGSLLALAQILDDGEQFAAVEASYVPAQPQGDLQVQQEKEEIARLFAQLETDAKGK
jgi:hypothetical protein